MFKVNRDSVQRSECPCFALFIGLLLWGTRNCAPQAERSRPNRV